MYSRLILIYFYLVFLFGCTKLPEAEPSSKVSYLFNGKRVETFYTKNVLIIEPSKTGNNFISFESISDNGIFGFNIVGNQIIGEYNYYNSLPEDYTNRMSYHLPNNDPFGYNSNDCITPTFSISITNYYSGQQTISGTFSGIVCDNDGNSIEIADGVFEFVKQF